MRIGKQGSAASDGRSRSAAPQSQGPIAVDLDPTVPEAPPEPEGPARILKPAAVPDWRGSSWDLLNGVEVSDETDSIPGDLFDSLFKR
ncbi:MAG TPA: hypothetical protein VHM00_03855 [Caldimonas sp.]|jgi:hypothetical protein|nr:hypothetical protein [Caldimonas sp.]HEX2540200.1 hypothetical protein [Caldimonas sp.]